MVQFYFGVDTYSYSVPQVLEPAQAAVFDIVPILNKIEQIIAISIKPHEVDFKDAEAVLVMEEDLLTAP